jgi:hypothetical protein
VLLVGAGIQRTIEHYGKAPAGLAEAAPAYLLRMADQPSTSPARPELPNIAVRLAQRMEGQAQPGDGLDAAQWAVFLDELAGTAHPPWEIAEPRGELSEHFAKYFDRFVIELFKEDATGRGWPALTLLFWGRLFSDVQRLERAGAANHAELQTRL